MARAISLVLLLGALGCGGNASSDNSDEGPAFSPSLLEQSWIVQLATVESLGPWAGNKGWASHVMKRNYTRSVPQFGADGGLATARAHADAADVFRQTAMMAGNSLVACYGDTPKDTDPVGVAHLLTVGYALRGELDKAREASARLPEGDPTWAWHLPWKTWLDSGGDWPPDLSGLPLEIPDPSPGTWPGIGALPHYELPEQSQEARTVAMGDPGALVAMALWHDAAARAAAGDQGDVIDTYSARYRWPVEGTAGGKADLPLEFLFGADYLLPSDAAFLAAALGGDAGAIDAYRDKSLTAAVAAASLSDGKIDAELATDNVSALRKLLIDAAAARTDGSVQGHHRTFADVARAGVTRNLSLLAEVGGDRETSGKLRIAAKDYSMDAAADPAGLLSLAAWDVGNRYPTRAQEIVHNQARRYEALEAARYALDVLALRISLERVGQSAGM